jgi:hypothetical protein
MYLKGFRKWRKIASIDLANHRQRLERVGPKMFLDLYLSCQLTVRGGESSPPGIIRTTLLEISKFWQ